MNLDYYLDLLVDHQKYVLLGLVLLFLSSLAVFIVINVRMGRLVKYYRTMLTGTEGKNLEEMLHLCSRQSQEAANKVEQILALVQNLDNKMNGCLQRVGMVRFNAFEDIGGEMSFALAILDENSTGFIISNIYGRQESHVYLRPVKQGKSVCFLLPEEEKALQEALGV